MAASGTTKKITSNQILGAGGTATLASATITGDLTVDTSTLKVDSANNRVGILTTTPAYALDVNGDAKVTNALRYFVGATQYGVSFANAGVMGLESYQGTYFSIGTGAGASATERFRIANDGVCTWSEVGGVAGTAMTLNSTGLGVGLNPSSYAGRLVVGGTPAATSGAIVYVRDTFANGSNNSLGSIMFASSPGSDFYVGKKVSSGVSWFSIGNANSGAEYFQIDSSGNVGVGVTPSYRLQSAVASGADGNIFAAQVIGASNGFQVLWNHATTTTRVIIANIPTSSAGLAAGTLWNDAGTIKIA
jgi:hypothetical protein